MYKILIVDDNYADRELLKEILLNNEDDYQIELAESGQEAIQKIKTFSPDVTLLDIQMGDVNGFEVIERLRVESGRPYSVILVSSFTESSNRATGLELGVADFITKPIIAEEVRARVANQLKLKKMHDDMSWAVKKTNEGIKVLYSELEKKNKELERLDQLKSDFVSTVSHELRTPLAIITEGLSLLLDQIPGKINAKQQDILNTSKKNIDRLSRIIDDLLDVSKIEAGKMDLDLGFTNFVKILNDYIKGFQSVVKKKNIELKTNFPPKTIFLNIDSDKITQVISNLLNNAFKFTEDGGTIEVAIQERDDDVVCSVRDSGMGISKEDQVKLFDKFQQFGRKEGPGIKGTGLGLSICKSLVDLHKGQIWVESKPGEGAAFFFSIPSYQAVREEFGQEFEAIIKEHQLNNKSCVFGIISLHNYDAVSKQLGQDEAIELMRTTLRAVKDVVSKVRDQALLYYHDQIYFLFPETDKAGGLMVAKRIKESISSAKMYERDNGVDLDLKMGLAAFPVDGQNADELIKNAKEEAIRFKTILVVDDEEELLNLLHTRFKGQGYQVLKASDGEEALEILKEKKVDLVVLDILMPGMNGYEVYGRIKESPQTVHVPVVFLSATEVDKDKINVDQFGSVPCVPKAGGWDVLFDIVKQTI